ncbi:MAG: MotA/TolQ/ExbB proton channel family protein [Salinivirgaceae bacterium]|nr:MotA/TolQ/ExbB proton channel family protein [Salinivirgaceae bacterium]
MSFFQYMFSNPLGFIFLLLILGIFGFGPYLFIRLYFVKSKAIKKMHIDSMLVLGAIALVYGVLLQIIGMVQALEAVIQAADVSPQLVMQGLKESFMTPILGMVLFIVSIVFWYLNKLKWESNLK